MSMATDEAEVLTPELSSEVSFARMRVEEVRKLWLRARAEVWRREARRLDRKQQRLVAAWEAEDQEPTSDSLHPEGF